VNKRDARPNDDWLIPDWPKPAGVRAIATTRSGGVSVGPFGMAAGAEGLNLGAYCGDAASAVVVNRQRVASLLPAPPIWLRQVHGTRVHKIWQAPTVEELPQRNDQDGADGHLTALGTGPEGDGHLTGLGTEPEADAAVTDRRGVVLAVLSADCLPVLLCDDKSQVIGVAHAGWRGLAAGVLDATVAAMRERLPAGGDILAWLGPAIGPSAFEVGEDVLTAFEAVTAGATRRFRAGRVPGKWFADLPGLAVDQLSSCGVERVATSGLCTFSDADRFFSHRRDRVTGRQACLLWLER
jgi:YfiH family protein